MSAGRAGKVVVDWVGLGSRLRDATARAELDKLRMVITDLETQHRAIASKLAPIDWDAWKATIRTPGVVDDLRKSHEAFSVPAFETSALEKRVQEVFATYKKESEEEAKFSVERLKELDAKIAALDARMALEDVTVEEELRNNPEIAREIEKEIKENNWDE
eukprot:TRINITY_DN249_c0_g2_i1.p1 TRINITY_DN249_c0_g2~~TRINITY_DN249_c0_g2_i1.p1  ORF type:complete len:161 (-),score=47.40 TRINITY_DN249_c0_g2_i1:161-643(-)